MLQILLPRRNMPNVWKQARFTHNLALFLINAVLIGLLLPISLLGVATKAEEYEFGLFNLVAAPAYLETLFAFVLLDLSIYLQHVATHKISWLWQIHKVHHADREMDVSTSIRFHPLEVLLTVCYTALIIALLGASALAVAVFILMRFIGSAFNHSNIHVPARLDKILRWVIATPDVHRTHHSVHQAEQDSNYAFFLIWWDKLFNTYTEAPRKGHSKMAIGLSRRKESEQTSIDQMLLAPFSRRKP